MNVVSGFPSDTEARRYSELSGYALLFVLISPVIAYAASLTNLTFMYAIGVLIVPVAMFVWIFITIRAIHKRTIRFWFIPSTYVAFFGSVAAAVCLFIGVLFGRSSDVHPGVPAVHDTMLIAAAILQASTTLWCLWYNWKKTDALVLAFSLTAIQTLFSCLVVAFFWLRFGGSGDREHIDAATGQSNVREQIPV